MADFSDKIVYELEAKVNKALKNLKKIDKQTKQTTKSSESMFSRMKIGYALIGTVVTGAVAGLTKKLTGMAGAYEQTKVSFETFLGSAKKGNAVLKQLEKFSTVTPFDIDSVNKAGQALLAFGVESEKLIPTLKSIGDVASATGKDFNELSLIYGKAKTAGTLYAEDINQLTEAGIPIIKEFAKQMGVTEGEVKKLASQGKIGFSQLETAFNNMTGEGGQFFNLMEKQSKTFNGRVSTLVGNMQLLGRSIGEKLLPAMGSVVDLMNDWLTPAKDSEQLTSDLVSANNLYRDSLVDVNNQLDSNSESQKRNNKILEATGLVAVLQSARLLKKEYNGLKNAEEQFKDGLGSSLYKEQNKLLEKNKKALEDQFDAIMKIGANDTIGVVNVGFDKWGKRLDGVLSKERAIEVTIDAIAKNQEQINSRQGEREGHIERIRDIELEIAQLIKDEKLTDIARARLGEQLIANATKRIPELKKELAVVKEIRKESSSGSKSTGPMFGPDPMDYSKDGLLGKAILDNYGKLEDEQTRLAEEGAKNREAILKQSVNSILSIFSSVGSAITSSIDNDIAQLQSQAEKQKEGLESSQALEDLKLEADKERIEELEAKRDEALRRGDTRTEKETQAELDRINLEKKNAKEKEAIDNRLASQQKKLKEKQFKQKKAFSIVETVINTAMAMSNAIKDFPFPANIPIAAAMGTAGTVQTGVIASQQMPAFAQGTPSGGLITNGPQVFLAGDNQSGRERIDVTPLNSSDNGGSSGNTYQFYGINDLSDARNELQRIEGVDAWQ